MKHKPRPKDLPPWTPKAGAETRWFIEWTIEQWYNLYDPPDADDACRDGQGSKIARAVFPEAPILMALTEKDEAKFLRLMRDPAQARIAFRMLLPKPKGKVGRPKEAEPAHYLDWPLEVVSEIEYLWKRHYKKWQRTNRNPPTVYSITETILKRERLDIQADVIQARRRKVGKV